MLPKTIEIHEWLAKAQETANKSASKLQYQNKDLTYPELARPVTLMSFWDNTQGATAMLFGIAAVPILLSVGAGIDYSRGLIAKTTIQSASDAAALTLVAQSATYVSSPATLNKAAQALLDARATTLTGPITLGSATVDKNTLETCVNTTAQVPTAIMSGFKGLSTITVSGHSCAKPQDHYEIALVLDTTGSMAESAGAKSKLNSAVDAANSLIQILEPPGLTTPMSSISIVPFAAAVNVRAQGLTDLSFLDFLAQSSIHWQNYAFPKDNSGKLTFPTSRFDIYGNMNGGSWSAAWKGCVEERPFPYTLSDDAPSSYNPDTLFVPYLYPDEPDPSSGNQYTLKKNTYVTVNSYNSDQGGTCQELPSSNAEFTAADNQDPVSQGSGMAKVCKYRGATPSHASSPIGGYNGNASSFFPMGPSLGCEVAPLLPLTVSVSALQQELNTLTPNGDTDLITGVMWGWRTLSPNGPFKSGSSTATGYQAPKPYTNQANRKVMILMTDGANHWTSGSNFQFGSTYTALGYMANDRLGPLNGSVPTDTSNYRSQMDAATLQACRSARASGVSIYTIGFSVPSNPIDAQGLQVLQQCAGTSAGQNSSMAFTATDSASIVATFQHIANNLAKIRLTH